MSYDIYFLSRRDGQSWDDALEAMEDAAEESEPIPARICAAATAVDHRARRRRARFRAVYASRATAEFSAGTAARLHGVPAHQGTRQASQGHKGC
ncbi:hypothetical protein GCM10010270_35160 [Streptomyces violaceus]|nr:hypothetical protein GCM10010270_35160 [Streptomyces janthinus]